MGIKEFNRMLKKERLKRKIRLVVRLSFAIAIFIAGMYVNEKVNSHLLYEEIRQAQKIMRDHPSSIVVLTKEVADALEYRADLDPDAKQQSNKVGLVRER